MPERRIAIHSLRKTSGLYSAAPDAELMAKGSNVGNVERIGPRRQEDQPFKQTRNHPACHVASAIQFFHPPWPRRMSNFQAHALLESILLLPSLSQRPIAFGSRYNLHTS
jgi:hypothetical protein